MSPILKRDLCFIAKYAAIGLIVSVGITATVFSEKRASYHADTAPPVTISATVQMEPLALVTPITRTVVFTPH